MGTKIPNWLNNTWLQHRFLLVTGLSVTLHLLAWSSINWGGIFEPSSHAKKVKKKGEIALDFIKSKPKTLAIVPDKITEKSPERPSHYATRSTVAANTKPPTETNETPHNIAMPVKGHSIINAPPAPPKLTDKQIQKHKQVAVAPQIPQPEKQTVESRTPRAGLNASLTPKSSKASANAHALDNDRKHSTTKQLRALPTPELLLPKDNPIHSPSRPKHANIFANNDNALDRLKRIRKGTGGSTPLPSFSNPNGGIKTNSPFSLDVEGLVGSAEYDKRMLTAIYLHWIDLNNKHGTSNSYKVVVLFEQNDKGEIKSLRVDSVNADRSDRATSFSMPGYICGSSIQGLSPYGNWPDTMRNRIGENQRRCRFTFHYNIIRR